MNRLLVLLFLIPLDLFAQGEFLMQLPISKEILKVNKVSTVNVLEKLDSVLMQTNTYFINKDGQAFEHIYYNPANEGGGPFDIERLRWSEDTLGLVLFTRGMYAESGDLIKLLERNDFYFSPTNKVKEVINYIYLDYLLIIKNILDTIHPEFNNRTECRIMNDDTLFIVRDYYDGLTRIHHLRTKKDGKWEDTEIGTSYFKNGELDYYTLYKNGVKVQEFNAKDIPSNLGNDKKEEDFGLPMPEPFTKIVYSDKMDLIYESNAKDKTAKFRLELHYENGASNEMDYYEVYDNANNLLLIKSNPTGEYKTEFHYLFRK